MIIHEDSSDVVCRWVIACRCIVSHVTIDECLQEIDVVDTHNKCCGTICVREGYAGKLGVLLPDVWLHLEGCFGRCGRCCWWPSCSRSLDRLKCASCIWGDFCFARNTLSNRRCAEAWLRLNFESDWTVRNSQRLERVTLFSNWPVLAPYKYTWV